MRWVPLDECVDAVLDRRVHNSLAVDRRARGAGGARTRLADAGRGGCPVAEPIARGGTPGITMTASAPVDEYLRHLAIERGLAREHGRRVSSRPHDLRRLARDARHRRRRVHVTERDLGDFVRFLGADREPPLSTASIARVLSSVRGLHRFLVEEGAVEADVAASCARRSSPMRLPKAITVEEVEALLAAAGGDEVAEIRDKALLELLYATGARVSEAVSLNVDDLVDGEVVRLFGKGGKQRIVPVGSYARRAVDAYLVRARPLLSARGSATPALFLGMRGRRMSRQARVGRHPRCGRARRHRGDGVAAHPAPLVRDPSARGRRRRAGRPGAARALVGGHDADLHAGHSRYTPRDVHGSPPTCSLESTKQLARTSREDDT